jgi:hypothetical protein
MPREGIGPGCSANPTKESLSLARRRCDDLSRRYPGVLLASTSAGGQDDADERGLRYLCRSHSPTGSEYTVDFAIGFFLRTALSNWSMIGTHSQRFPARHGAPRSNRQGSPRCRSGRHVARGRISDAGRMRVAERSFWWSLLDGFFIDNL